MLGRLATGRTGAALCAAVVGVVSLGFYLATLAPGLTWAHDSADGGELAVAASTLGIPHPPGYPTYVLLAHSFTLLPVGEVATRTNLFSAVCAAGAAALLTWTLARTARNYAAAVGAGLALAFSPILWAQATVTEVHTLNALFAALLLALAVPTEPARMLSTAAVGVIRPHRPPGQAVLLALAVGSAWGLSLGNHPTALFCGPLVLLALWRLRRFRLLGAAGIVLGLSVYLYLPLRAAADPPINWGDPQTLERFWWMVSGAPYRYFLFSLPRAYLPGRLLAWAGLLTQQFGRAGIIVAILGAIALWVVKRPFLVVTATTVALCSVFAIGYDTTDSYLYLVPGLVCLGLWLGVGADWLIGEVAKRARWLAWVVAVLAIGLPLAAAVYRFPMLDLSDDRAARDFGNAILGGAPPEAIVLSQRDTHTFALWYFRYAHGLRPDIVVVDLGLLGYDWYTAHLSRRLAVPVPVDVLMAPQEESLRQAAEVLDRPVCWIDLEWTGLSCAGTQRRQSDTD